MRSLSAAMVPWIQQLPQYVGMCWFTSAVTRLRPPTLRQSKEAGMAAAERDGSAESTSGGGRTAARWWPWIDTCVADVESIHILLEGIPTPMPSRVSILEE